MTIINLDEQPSPYEPHCPTCTCGQRKTFIVKEDPPIRLSKDTIYRDAAFRAPVGECEHGIPWRTMGWSHYAMHHKTDHP